jgi:urease alpha subunit
VSLAFLARDAVDAELPTTRTRSAVRGCRDVTAADMVRNDRLAEVDVSPDGTRVTVDGEPVGIEPVDEVPMGWRHLLG